MGFAFIAKWHLSSTSSRRLSQNHIFFPSSQTFLRPVVPECFCRGPILDCQF